MHKLFGLTQSQQQQPSMSPPSNNMILQNGKTFWQMLPMRWWFVCNFFAINRNIVWKKFEACTCITCERVCVCVRVCEVRKVPNVLCFAAAFVVVATLMWHILSIYPNKKIRKRITNTKCQCRWSKQIYYLFVFVVLSLSLEMDSVSCLLLETGPQLYYKQRQFPRRQERQRQMHERIKHELSHVLSSWNIAYLCSENFASIFENEKSSIFRDNKRDSFDLLFDHIPSLSFYARLSNMF